ncbi:heme oxygenase (biliverdin-producing) [Paenarthrobacter sp. NPDC090520]|uniref:biliverdin-producing heme oxygenase n=1 Tax=Paenarthrobacter sp. NPDC090520 TaxID=3364382 RepID=UPI00382A4D0C
MAALSEDLRVQTAAAHEHAENSTFISELLAGRLKGQHVGWLLRQNLLIYRAFEGALRRTSDSRLRDFHDPALERVPALESDLVQCFGRGWESRPAEGDFLITPASRAYADELAGAASTSYLLAQHYVRYLGDLSGGQIISTLVQRHYGLSPDRLHFYAFDHIGKIKPYKDAYRTRLDQLELTSTEKAEVVSHAVAAFESNRRVFVDLMDLVSGPVQLRDDTAFAGP